MLAKKIIQKSSLFLCLLGIGIAILLFTTKIKKEGTDVLISIDGKDVKSFNLSDNVVYDIDQLGHNTLMIENGYVWIDSADCPDELCVKFGKISKSGESIICLPHKLIIRIENTSDKEELDAFAK